jgi:hypothetical protein
LRRPPFVLAAGFGINEANSLPVSFSRTRNGRVGV